MFPSAIFFVCSLVTQDHLETLCSVSYYMVVVNKQTDYSTNFAQKPFYLRGTVPLNIRRFLVAFLLKEGVNFCYLVSVKLKRKKLLPYCGKKFLFAICEQSPICDEPKKKKRPITLARKTRKTLHARGVVYFPRSCIFGPFFVEIRDFSEPCRPWHKTYQQDLCF